MRSHRRVPTASALAWLALPAAALAWSSQVWIGSWLWHPRRGAADLVVHSLPGAAEEPASGAANSSSYASRPNWRKRYRRVLPFDEARRCVQAIGFGNREEWDEWVAEGKKSPFLGPYVPSDPEAMYAEEWQGWDDFLGCILPFSKARLVSRMLGLQSQEAWYTFVEDDPVRLRSLRLPALPSIYYSSEWQGYEDWLALPNETLFPFLAAAWTPPELSPSDEFRNQELLQQSLFEEYYHLGTGLAQVTPKLREMARAALTTWPAIAFGIANGLYHFCFYREDWDPDAGLPPSAMLNIEDMVLAEQLLQVSVAFSRCLDSAQDPQSFLVGMCQQKLALLFLVQNELGASLAEGRELKESARVLRAAQEAFRLMKESPYHAMLGAIGWRLPSHVALNDELYPRTFGAVWPSSSFPYAEFLESNFEVFLQELQSILAEEGLFEQLRRAASNAEGLAVWPPDTRGHIQLLDGRDESLLLPTCAFAQRSCALLASRPELADCPRAAAFLARLEPGAWLKPHLGNSRRLAAHLGLVTPPGAVLNVGSARSLPWGAGRTVIWDDTHVHDARHAGKGTRYILQSFFCHPCEQKDLYRGHPSPEVQSLASDASCEFANPVRAEVSRALRQEMDERERAYRAMPRMTVNGIILLVLASGLALAQARLLRMQSTGCLDRTSKHFTTQPRLQTQTEPKGLVLAALGAGPKYCSASQQKFPAGEMADADVEELTQRPEDFDLPTVEDAIRFMVTRFLETTHRRKLHEILACKWDRYQSAQAAVKLLGQHGVELSPEDEAHLSGLGDSELIDALVQKIPEQSSEQFQAFFLELQLVVSAALRIRKGLEEAKPDEVSQALDDVELSNVGPHVMKMAVVQAGSDVMTLGLQHKAWIQESQLKLSVLVRGQEEAMAAKKKLAAANAVLHNNTVSQNEKAKKVVATFLHGSVTALLKSVLASWLCIMRREKSETAVHREYRDRIERMQKQLAKCKQDQLAMVRSMFMRKSAAGILQLKRELFATWREEVEESKIDNDVWLEVKKVERQLAALKATQAGRMKQVIESVTAVSYTGLITACIRAWQGEVGTKRKEQELQRWLVTTRKKLAQLQEANRSLTRTTCARLAEQFDVGLLSIAMRSWVQTLQEAKQSSGMAESLSSVQGKLSTFGAKNAVSALKTMEQASDYLDEILTLRCFHAWRLDQKMSMISSQHGAVIEGKRTQLQNVQYMFRTFALKLEAEAQEMKKHSWKRERRIHSKGENTVSLPDIHARPGAQQGPDEKGAIGAGAGLSGGDCSRSLGPPCVSLRLSEALAASNSEGSGPEYECSVASGRLGDVSRLPVKSPARVQPPMTRRFEWQHVRYRFARSPAHQHPVSGSQRAPVAPLPEACCCNLASWALCIMQPAKKARLCSSTVKAPKLVKVATCNLNQWAMDFKGNLERVKESIKEAKAQGCSFRTGPELEITGYGCEDHFLENDTFLHAWSSMADLLKTDLTDGILCDIGMPVMHRNVPYNCRVWVVNRSILGIRPKIFLANDGNYREMRWFTPWHIDPGNPGFGELEEYFLPREIAEITGNAKVPFGIFAVSTKDTCLATETCEELFTPDAPHIKLALDGVEIIANGSGSHHQLRKLDKRIDLVRGATSKSGGVYLYANVKGCDGGRLYFDGCCMVWSNGKLLAQGTQFGMLDEIEVVVATVNLNDVRSMRSNFIARSYQASSTPTVHRVEVDFSLCHPDPLSISESQPIEPKIVNPMEEIAYGPSAWLWDYLRRSGQRGYFLPLSGGADSSSTAALVGIMCQRVFRELTEGTERSKALVLADIRKVTRRPFYTPPSWQDFCGKIFVTCYMASEHSGSETRSRAENLAKQIGANHTSIAIRPITDGIVKVFQQCQFESDKIDKSKVKADATWNQSGTEDIALQNIQARSRMVMAYFMAQLMPWATDKAMKGEVGPGWGSLLVLGSANVDEALRGYYTKYDCSAADINPIGGINKRDLKAFLKWAAKEKGIGELEKVANAVPTAELRPDKAHDPRSIWAMAAMNLRSGGPATWALVVILGLGGAWLQPAKGPWVRHGRVGLRATGGAEAVDTDDLLVALGRNLWAAADELLEVSATLAALGLVPRSDDGNSRKFSPLGLGSAALALRNAADNILDDDWENAMGELEVASVSCEGYLPSAFMQGVVDLFSYEEPIPECEWSSARQSFRGLSRNLFSIADRLGQSSNPLAESLRYAGEKLRSAGKLFVEGGFQMPKDPRFSRGERGEWSSQSQQSYYGNFYSSTGPSPEAQLAEEAPPGTPAAKLVESIRLEIEDADAGGPQERRALLRKLVRRLHPDQNPGKEIEGGKKVEEQSDEKDMGMSYDELGDLGHLRKVEKCGPLSTFLKLRQLWSHKTADWTGPQDNDRAITPSIRVKEQPKSFDEKVAQKVKDFYFYNAINRHKMTTLTPSYHAENYSPDDNRFDLRPFLFPATFEAQFEAIDEAPQCQPEVGVACVCRSGQWKNNKKEKAEGEEREGASVLVLCSKGTCGFRSIQQLVNDIITELLDSRPQPLTAPELRKNLKPRLVALILDSIAAEGLNLQLANESPQKAERGGRQRQGKAVARFGSIPEQVTDSLARLVVRRQCSVCGIPHYLAVVDSEDGDSDAWARAAFAPYRRRASAVVYAWTLAGGDDGPGVELVSECALANKDYAASAWGGFETYMSSLDQGLLALAALVIGNHVGSLAYHAHDVDIVCMLLPASHVSLEPPNPVAMLRYRTLLCFFLAVVLLCIFANAAVLYRGGVWRAYFLPTEDVWDSIHEHGKGLAGGIWGYNQSKLENYTMMRYLYEKPYESIWDVSCNVGFMLASLLKRHPGAKHYGTDISNVMVAATRENCPSCMATQFDLGNLVNPAISPQEVVYAAWHQEDAPRFFDVILVSDVLLFIRWGGIPPILLRCSCCCSMFRKWALPSQRAFINNIASLARDEVVFSYNQGNIIVSTMMQELGIEFDKKHSIYKVPGAPVKSRDKPARSSRPLQLGLADWLDFTKISLYPADVVSDPLELFFVVAWGISSCLGWYAQLFAVAAGVDPLALPDSVAFRLQQLEKYFPWFFDNGQEFASKILPQRLSQESMPFLPKEEVEMDDLSEKTPNYKPEGVLAAMVFSVLLLNFFMLGKPLLFLGHVVLMAAAFQAFLLLGTFSKSRAIAVQDRRSYELRITEPNVAWAFGIQFASAAPLHACNVQHSGSLLLYRWVSLHVREPLPGAQVPCSPVIEVLLDRDLVPSEVTLALLFVMTFSGAAKMFAGLTSGNADDVAKFHSHLGKTLYGFAGVSQVLGYFMPELLSLLLTVILIASTSATIAFLNGRSPEVVKRMKRFDNGSNESSWEPAREASLKVAKPTYRPAISSAATTRIESLRTITRRNSSITSIGAGMPRFEGPSGHEQEDNPYIQQDEKPPLMSMFAVAVFIIGTGGALLPNMQSYPHRLSIVRACWKHLLSSCSLSFM
ncbi:nadsyn1 [Symbiodinium necroappetens]|uniref:NAD(+) synthase (glutamine-hydrolyzing) n=1 Tax=Symbiodinium necroappetens TaxID=1628268 RepID=A0A812JWY7_9DINO|nr:nadsyn1 [Symbiodinium necroappetens]